MQLFHVGFSIIDNPDIHYGRKNADFGQGFYLSDDSDFSHRWAKHRIGQTTYINSYELNLDGLKVKQFERDAEWFSYIFANRRVKNDSLMEYDVIIGPIANDTIYDVMGITTSGYLEDEDALKLLQAGKIYHQIVIKSEKAKEQLVWLGAEPIEEQELLSYRAVVEAEEKEFQEEFAKRLTEIVEE